MPKLDEPEKIERNPIPVGRHVLTLTSVKDHEGPNTYQPQVLNDETGEMEYPIRREWIWQFESETVDKKTGRKFEYAVWTPRYFNPTSETNKLTLLARMLAPDATGDELVGMIETDHFIGKRWRVRIVHTVSEKGKTYARHLYFIPLAGNSVDEIPA